jgi:tRNA pseudouridine synthase 10
MSKERSQNFEAAAIVEKIFAATKEYEFDSFVVGFERDEGYLEPQRVARDRRLKSEIGTALGDLWPGRRVDFKYPTARIDVRRDLSVTIKTAPIFIGARYRKLSRHIPASRWTCLVCQGAGCESCTYTGNLCGTSVEQVIGRPLLEQSGGTETSFHGAGREDTDARMLGHGRPFVIEVHQPVRRSIDLTAWAASAFVAGRDLCEILDPCPALREDVRALKDAAAEKTYRAWVRIAEAPPPDAGERLAALAGTPIEQYSPTRVMRRRGKNTLRPKRIIESKLRGLIDGLLVWELRTDSGAYVKEIVSGDDGRTRPSLSETLGSRARCERLDVLEIHWTPPWEARRDSTTGRSGGDRDELEYRA